jgi:hypothetical protein
VHRVHEEMRRGRSSSDEPATHAGRGSTAAPFSPRRSTCQPFHSPFTTRSAPAHLSFQAHTTYTEAPAFFTLILIHQIGPPSQTPTCTETEIPTSIATVPPTQQKRLPQKGRHSTTVRLPVELPRDPATSIYQAPWQLANNGRAATHHDKGSVGRI